MIEAQDCSKEMVFCYKCIINAFVAAYLSNGVHIYLIIIKLRQWRVYLSQSGYKKYCFPIVKDLSLTHMRKKKT